MAELSKRLRRAGQWVCWSPWRLLAVILAVIVVVWAAAIVRQVSEGTEVPGTAPTTVSEELPEGWHTWPVVTASVRTVDPSGGTPTEAGR